MKNLPKMEEILLNLKHLTTYVGSDGKLIEGYQTVFGALKSQANFRDGANFILSYMRVHGQEFINAFAFEFKYADEIARRADVMVLGEDGVSLIKYEFKSWTPGEQKWNGFFRGTDLKSWGQIEDYLLKSNKLTEIVYVFNEKKIVTNPDMLKQAFRELFRLKANEIFKLEVEGGAFTFERLESLFGTRYKDVFLQNIENLDSDIYSFIKF